MNIVDPINELYRKLCLLGFSSWGQVREEDLLNGAPALYAYFLRYIISKYKEEVIFYMKKHAWFFIENDDAKLVGNVLNLLREESGYNSSISAAQFKCRRYGKWKAQMCLAFIRLLSTDVRRLILPKNFLQDENVPYFEERKLVIHTQSKHLTNLPRGY